MFTFVVMIMPALEAILRKLFSLNLIDYVSIHFKGFSTHSLSSCTPFLSLQVSDLVSLSKIVLIIATISMKSCNGDVHQSTWNLLALSRLKCSFKMCFHWVVWIRICVSVVELKVHSSDFILCSSTTLRFLLVFFSEGTGSLFAVFEVTLTQHLQRK